MRITLRLPDAIYSALAARANSTGQPVSTYAIEVLAGHCGLEAGERRPGFASMPTERVAELARRGGRKSRKTARNRKKYSGRKA